MTTKSEDFPFGRNGVRSSRIPPAKTPTGEVRQTAQPPAAASARHEPLSLIHLFNTSHPARQPLYQGAIDAVDKGARSRQAEERAGTNLTHAEVAYETTRQSADRGPTGSLPLCYGAAGLTIAGDAVSCYLAAQVFGGDQFSTLWVTVLFLAGLAVGVIALHLAGRRKARTTWKEIAALIAVFILILGILRFAYLVTVNGNVLTALLGAGLFTVTTAGMVGLGYWALREAEPLDLYLKRRRLQKAWRQWAKAEETATDAASERHKCVKAYCDAFRPWLLATEANLTQETVQKIEQAVRQHLLETAVGTQPAQA